MDHARIARLLPETYQAAVTPTNPLGATLSVMETLHAPAEAALASLDAHVDPLRAPPDFALMLTRWLDLDRYLDWTGGRPGEGAPRYAAGLGRLRLLCLEAAHLSRWRGTRRTLERILTVATGLSGYTVQENPPGPKGAGSELPSARRRAGGGPSRWPTWCVASSTRNAPPTRPTTSNFPQPDREHEDEDPCRVSRFRTAPPPWP
jgi:phage tail-like protein